MSAMCRHMVLKSCVTLTGNDTVNSFCNDVFFSVLNESTKQAVLIPHTTVTFKNTKM